MNQNENPNIVNNGVNNPNTTPVSGVVPINTSVPSVVPVNSTVNPAGPTVVPNSNTTPTAGSVNVVSPSEIVNPAVENTPANLNNSESNPGVSDGGARIGGVDNTEFIHPEAFDIANAHQNKGAVVNEKLKTVEVQYTPPSKAKTFGMISLFLLLIAFVIFLPDITSFIDIHFSGKPVEVQEKIVDGRMICSLSTSTTNLDKNYEYIFRFHSNKLERLEYSVTTKGDPSLDDAALNDLASVCKQLSQNAEELNGVTVSCKYTTGKLVEVQNFDLQNVDMTQLNSSFSEAGGISPQYTYGQDMDSIERNMNASGHDCHRE